RPTSCGSEGAGDRRQQDYSPHSGDAAHQRGLRGVHRRRRLRCAVEDRRSSTRHRVRRHHDAAARRLSDLLADQAQQGVSLDSRHHAVQQGRIVRSRARPHCRLGALFDQAFHEGRAARGDRNARWRARQVMRVNATAATVRFRQGIAEQGMALILIVDDSPTEVHVMQKALERHGYRTASASDGAEAIRKAKEMKPDLIFMDVVMPGVNGFQATRKLASDPDTKSIPVIMVTSKDQETDRIWGMRQGAIDYLVKPVSMDKLIEKAQAALAG